MAQRWIDQLTFRSKATLAVALVTLLALLAVAVSGVIQMRGLAASEEQQTVRALAQGLGNASELALAVRDTRELSRLAERFMRNDHILLIAVYDKDEKVIIHRARSPELWERYRQGTNNTDIFYFSQPVTLASAANEFALTADDPSPTNLIPAAPSAIGRVLVGVSRAPTMTALRRQTQSMIVFTLLAAGVSAAMVFLLFTAWTRRLDKLVVASERIAQGDLTHAIDECRHDEIGRLSRGYEQMRQAVQQRDADLRRFNDTLQQQVQDRTRSLEEASAVTEMILKHMPVGILLVGSDKRVRRVNEAALAMTGAKSAEELVGSICHRHICPADVGKCPIWDCGQSVSNAEKVLLRADGTEIPVLKTVVPIVLHGEKLLLEAFVDITAQKHAEATLKAAKEAAEAADQAKSRFLATMSHEIRTPLNGVVGTVDLLRQTNLDENQRRYTQIAKSSADALLSVINDILDFSKIEAGRMELEAATFALPEMVEDVTRTGALVAARKNLEINCLVDPDVPQHVIGDAGRLRQILTNLLNNAIKFTEKGHIVLRATLSECTEGKMRVRFSISDTGIGIPADRQGRLFQSFSQVDSSTTRKYGGSGLGLAISKRLAEMMGGAIGVESQVGKGSTFWFTVLLAPATCAREMPRPIIPDMRRLRVIAVDDNAVNCEILQQQLSVWNLEGLTASNGPLALDMMKNAAEQGAPFDLAILDWHMPGMDGLELAKAIRACDSLQHTRLIMLTSIEDQISGTELQTLGFSGYLVKPVGQSQLYDTISNAFKKPGLPAPQEPTAAAAESKTAATAPRQATRVLLAEDNDINQMVAAAILHQAGFACDIVQNGIRAVAAAISGRYDVVLMDCQMPEMDGFAATREIRRREAENKVPPDARLPIVALTANAIKGDRELCLQAGMDDYVSKPIDHIKLNAAIHAAMKRSRWRRTSETLDHQFHEAPELSPAPPPTPANSASTGAPAGPSPESGDVPPLNVGELRTRCLNNIEFTQRILHKFQDRVNDDLTCLAKTIAERKMDQAANLAHSLKGSAANLAAPAVRAVAAEIETLSRAGDAAQAQQALQRLRSEVERCLAYIPKAVADLASATLEKSKD